MRRTDAATLIGLVAVGVGQADAQEWNAPAARFLVERAIARRSGMQADSGLQAFEARAHGFVFFLGQLGEELATTPRLIKADELVLEVYWRAPNRSKQRIIGWRERSGLPTGMQYHRDHLGIVTNGFGDQIRLGDGDEVRDVPHPLSPNGPALYDYALTDSLTIELPQRAVRVYEVLVRPRDVASPRVAGTLYVDATSAELVRFRFKFTRSAYLDPSVEDIAVVLDNGLWEGRYWLPRRQEIEIRRRTEWLDLPARGIIRGRWEIDEYRLNAARPESEFVGPEIVAAPRDQRAAYAWPGPLDAAITDATGGGVLSLAEIHAAVEDLVGGRVLTALPATQAGARSLSDVLRVNRVEGLAIGAGWVFRPLGRSLDIRIGLSHGTSDERLKGRVGVTSARGREEWSILASRAVVDVGDEPLASGVVNSLLSQEGGLDYGDYVLRDAIELRLRRPLSPRTSFTARVGVERTDDLVTVAQPVFGSYRANPPLGAGRFTVARAGFEREGAAGGWGARPDVKAALTLEGGIGDGTHYLRVTGSAALTLPVGATSLVVTGWGGWGSAELPRHRAITWGGRGAVRCATTPRCGGRYAATGTVEWRLGVFGGARSSIFPGAGAVVLAPFLTAGHVGGVVAGAPWADTDGVEPVGGVAIELFQHLVRAEIAVRFRRGRGGALVDVNRDLWPVL